MSVHNLSQKISKAISDPKKAKAHISKKIRNYRWERAKSHDQLTQQVLGFEMYLNPSDDGVSKFIFLDGVFAPDETAFHQDIIEDGMVIADIGANLGYFSLQFSGLTSGTVYAFEPDNHNFGLLQKNVRANKVTDIVTEQTAVASSTGEVELFKHPTNGGGHSIHEEGVLPFDEFPDDGEAENVSSVSFDHYFSRANRQLPDFVKIDVEGGEPDVLFGMEDSLHSTPVLSLEYTPHMWSEDPGSVFDYLESYGYEFYQIGASGSVSSISVTDILEFDDGWYDIVAAAEGLGTDQ